MTYTPTSADVSAGDDALAADYNALRDDLSTLLTSLFGAPTGETWDLAVISLDEIIEQTVGHGVDIDGVNMKDGVVTATNFVTSVNIQADIINEKTANNGINIDGAVVKDNKVTATNLQANTAVITDTISEKTTASGVTIDGVLHKDGAISGAGNASFASLVASYAVIVGGITLSNGGLGLRLDANLDLNGNSIRGLNKAIDFLAGSVNNGGTIPLPSGYSEGECAWMAAVRQVYSDNDDWSINGVRATWSGRTVTSSVYKYNSGWYNNGNASYVILGMKNRV